MRVPVLAGNWKMNGTVEESRELVASLVPNLIDAADREIVLAPPFTALGAVAELVRGTRFRLGAQNVHWEPKGAFTGEVSAEMLLEAGCRDVIVGHSERRQHFGETDEGVQRRAAAALAAGLRPIICLGESLEERRAGEALIVVERQVRAALLGLEANAIRTVCIAYEPIWAIGTGETATPAQAEEVHSRIRAVVAEVGGPEAAETVRILYGGSVKPENIDSLMAEDDIDGALVGGASLDAESFSRIVRFR